MNPRAFALGAATIILLAASSTVAEPIMKPRKYHGPIPQNNLSLRVGFFGDASNEEMNTYLDSRYQAPFQALSEDFGSGLTLELAYMFKPHPNFGLRVNASGTFLDSKGSGFFAIQANPGDSLLTALDYEREFKVELYVLELSGVYHFTDAAVKEFQPYLGGGFSFGMPHETIKETRTEQETGEPYTDEIPGVPTEASEWDFSAGAHVVGGAIFYLNNKVGLSGEARVQLMEGKFEQIQVMNEVGDFENVNFVVDYTGFYLTFGVTYAF